MKRFSSTGTLGAMIYPFQEKKNQHNHRFEYSTEFQAMLHNLENGDCTEESSRNGEKKRRLSLNQARALEKVFEEDNKLEAEKKVKVAQELGLEPRQVAIWFQNQRARWKKKRLERDYGVLKASYEALKLKFDEVEKMKEGLVAEVNELKSKLGEDYTKSNHFAQEATLLLESDNYISEHRFCPKLEQTNPSDEIPENENLLEITDHGLSEINCTLLLNEENDLNSHLLKPLPTPSSEIYEGCPPKYSPWMSCFHLLESRAKGHQNHFVKVEEQSTLCSTEAFHQQNFLNR